MSNQDNNCVRVSVLITNHNYGQFLPLCVGSLLSQLTSKEIELIIVDDGSTDGSLDVIDSLKDRHSTQFHSFMTLRLDTNRGKLHALNVGLRQVTGAVTIILDADDYLDAEYIDRTVDMLIKSNAVNDKIAFVYTDCWLVNEEGTILSRGKSTHFDASLLRTKSYVPECAPTWTCALHAALPFNETIRVATKHHKWQKILDAGWEGVYLEEPLFYYRMHYCNLSGIGLRILSEILDDGPRSSSILSGYWPTV
jgi:glycosyltransferase involved in cell wall biosynthesis